MDKIILASESPRRKEYFSLLGLDYEAIGANIDERANKSMAPDDLVEDLAYQKAYAVFKNHRNRTVIGCDTIVYAANEILGKPADEEDAKRMLGILSGKTHFVYTGVSIITEKMSRTFHNVTEVVFCDMSDEEISTYVKSGEPMDKAGAYAAQGLGSKFIKEIRGDFFTVIGLPLSQIYQELKAMGIMI
ncbi:MAG TPA: Maf family protein [Bacillota bacterium]|mgnify:FL=1|nr:Maf family protein [Bacillota bacterium]HPF42313.1 Maf family protein [Bacillota bacterium]HPQ61882.1 Maf family protein [Bacillota bacterium]